MEFDEIVVKESPGLCRCCLSEGCYKDLATEYTWMNETEVYADMLMECFDISISQHNEGPNGPNRLICEVCITRLRDACNFKKQVLDSEKKFIDMVAKGQFKPKVLIYQAQMKSETNLDDAVPADDGEVEYLEEELNFGDDDLMKVSDDATDQAAVSEEITVATLPVKGKRGRPKKNATTVKTEKKAKVARLEEKPKTSKAVSKETTAPNFSTESSSTNKDEAVVSASKKVRLRRYLHHILQYSTVMPFRRHGNKYKCFYCASGFHSSSDLRKHSLNEKSKVDLKRIIAKNLIEFSIKLDITDLRCKICSERLTSLKELTHHLEQRHDKPCEDLSEFILCFELSDDVLKCLQCHQKFTYFGPLLIHTQRSHVQRKFICETCGISFSSKGNILRHIQSVHPTDSYQCRQCDKKFRAMHRRDIHEQRIHDVEKRKCHVCFEILDSVFKKDTHLATVHKIWSSENKCESCPKTFRFKNLLVNHIKRVHLKEKNVTCDICGDKFFDKYYLRLHKVKHSDAKPFECDVCKRKFPRKQTLDFHSRIHTNDKRYVCKICKKAFIQTSSLKVHLKIHHRNEALGTKKNKG